MKFLRAHWYDIGGGFAILVLGFVWINFNNLSSYQLIVWLSLVSLFFHQLEEYRIVGSFPGMVNKVLFKSELPDRYPLNSNTALIINVIVGWLFYFLAAVFAEKAIWLGIATILVSAGNTIAHTFMFNIKGKTFYNAGMLSSLLLFAPICFFFFKIIYEDQLITTMDYLIGIPLGIVLNVVGVLKLIEWLADKNSPYIFAKKNLLAADRDI